MRNAKRCLRVRIWEWQRTVSALKIGYGDGEVKVVVEGLVGYHGWGVCVKISFLGETTSCTNRFTVFVLQHYLWSMLIENLIWNVPSANWFELQFQWVPWELMSDITLRASFQWGAYLQGEVHAEPLPKVYERHQSVKSFLRVRDPLLCH